MSCRREDGTFTSADVGPSLPAHDFAHLIVERALGELATGACTCDQYADRVATELRQMGLEMPAGVSAESAERMLLELEGLMRHFGELSPGESMEVEWKR